MENITALGYGGDNIGDLCYPHVFRLAFPDKSFVFTPSVTGVNDITILAGGNICFSEYTNQLKSSRNRYAFSVSINQGSDFKSLQDYNRIIVRDLKSKELLKEHNIESTYAPDFSIFLKPNIINGRELIKKYFTNFDLYKKIVCVSLNSNLLYSPDHSRPVRDEINLDKFLYELADVFDNTPASFILLPFSTDSKFDDRIISGMAARYAKFHKKNVIVYDKLNFQDALDITSACDATIGSRLHSLIFSYISAVPFIDITHDTKTINFINSVKTGYSIPYESFTRKECKKILENIFDNKLDLHINILMNLNRQKQILKGVIKRCGFPLTIIK